MNNNEIERIVVKFKSFYGENNIVVNGLSDDEDNNGDKIDRTEIIINGKEAVTLEAYEDGEVDVIFDDVEINRDNIRLYYEFMSDEDLVENKEIVNAVYTIGKYHFLVKSVFDWEDKKKNILSEEQKEIASQFISYDGVSEGNSYFQTKQFVFGVKDTLKPIDEYIEDVKNSDGYKEYLGLDTSFEEIIDTSLTKEQVSEALESFSKENKTIVQKLG